MRILVADAIAESHLNDLKTAGFEVRYRPELKADELGQHLEGVSVLVVRSTKVGRDAIAAGRSLGMILRAGAGYDTIDVGAASERGIFVSNCPGKNADAVAELTFALMLALDRRVVRGSMDLAAGRWNKKEYQRARGLKGATLGVIGLGSIGRAVIERARAFEMNVLAWSRSLTGVGADELGVGYCRTPLEVAERADIITVHLAQTAETKGLFGDAFFQRIKPGAMFINTSRGGLHDQAALLRAMKERGVRAGLDVYESEPTAAEAEGFHHEMFAMPTFVGTHHIGASTDQAQDAIAAEAVRIIREYHQTGRPSNVVNIEVRAPARCELVVRHYDRVGALAEVLGAIRTHGINVADMSNTIFQGQKAAVASIRIDREPPVELLRELEALELVIGVEQKRL